MKNKDIKFYFAGSIRGGRDKLDIYKAMNEMLEEYGEVLDKHVARSDVDNLEQDYSKEFIYQRDMEWILESDILIAEVSQPSLGVGYEIGYAEKHQKPIIAFCEQDINLSRMISGNPNVKTIYYRGKTDLLQKLEEVLKAI